MSVPTQQHNGNPLKIFDLAKSQGRFLFASAPMVRYSKLAFRQTVYAYGADLCWTPMILAKEFNRSHFARESDFTTSTRGLQPTTIVQFGSNSALEFSRASALVAPYASGVDLNCGCPQSWACAEALGAALMERRELVRDIVLETRQTLRRDGWYVGREDGADSTKGRSVSVKIRVHKDLRKTVDFLHTVVGHAQDRHIDFLTIHPRTRHTPSSTPINFEALRILTSTFGETVPILLSGDVFTVNPLPLLAPLQGGTISLSPAVTRSGDSWTGNSGSANGTLSGEKQPAPLPPQIPNLAGLMSARALLCNPALFGGHTACPWEAVSTFMSNVVRCPIPYKLTLHHVSEMCGPGMGPDKTSLLSRAERREMMGCGNFCELVDFLDGKIGERASGEGELRRSEVLVSRDFG